MIGAFIDHFREKTKCMSMSNMRMNTLYIIMELWHFNKGIPTIPYWLNQICLWAEAINTIRKHVFQSKLHLKPLPSCEFIILCKHRPTFHEWWIEYQIDVTFLCYQSKVMVPNKRSLHQSWVRARYSSCSQLQQFGLPGIVWNQFPWRRLPVTSHPSTPLPVIALSFLKFFS